MKANELMIGDWVMYNPNVFIEDEYELTKESYPIQIIRGEDINLAIEGCYQPIPLTLEILEKNGFKPYIPEYHLETVYACQDVSKAIADELYALWPYQDGSFYLLLRVDGKDMVRMDVHYIHQLQHALRLCGIKKEIVL